MLVRPISQRLDAVHDLVERGDLLFLIFPGDPLDCHVVAPLVRLKNGCTFNQNNQGPEMGGD
jgi:hypothetical protein